MSCCGCSRKFGGGGASRQGVVVEKGYNSQISPHATWNIQKWAKNGRFPTLIDLKLPKTQFYTQKYLNKIHFQDFLRNT
jgi:hypothetical protein